MKGIYLKPGQPVIYKGQGRYVKKTERIEEGFLLYHLVVSNWLAKKPIAIVREVELPSKEQLEGAGFNSSTWAHK